MPKATILVVDDEQLIRWSLAERLSSEGYGVIEAQSGEEALARFGSNVDLVLLDYRLGDTDGLRLLKKLHQSDPELLVILLTAYADVETAVAVMKEGAYHYAAKPFLLDEIVLLVEKGLDTTRLRREVRALRASQGAPCSLDRIIGLSPAIVEARALLGRIASSPASTVLLTGESGTGKHLAARVIHDMSDRAGGPFVNITCPALTETSLASELFGREQRALAAARRRRRGVLAAARGGTVFLDEIGEMPPAPQAKLLRFLEERSRGPVNGTEDVDVRVIAATSRDLERRVRDGAFREDLFRRLNVLRVALPPLRDRADDIPVLTRFFVDGFNREFAKRIRRIDPAAMAALGGYGWPGNVRELRSAVERAVLLSPRDCVTAGDFPLQVAPERAPADLTLPAAGTNLDDIERSLVIQALGRTGWNQTRAAALLGLNRDQIRRRIEKFGLTR